MESMADPPQPAVPAAPPAPPVASPGRGVGNGDEVNVLEELPLRMADPIEGDPMFPDIIWETDTGEMTEMEQYLKESSFLSLMMSVGKPREKQLAGEATARILSNNTIPECLRKFGEQILALQTKKKKTILRESYLSWELHTLLYTRPESKKLGDIISKIIALNSQLAALAPAIERAIIFDSGVQHAITIFILLWFPSALTDIKNRYRALESAHQTRVAIVEAAGRVEDVRKVKEEYDSVATLAVVFLDNVAHLEPCKTINL